MPLGTEEKFWPKSRFIKDTRDNVINMRGELGNPTHGTPITVTSIAQAVTITAGKRFLKLTNVGAVDCYFGALGVTSANGTPLYSNGEMVVFENVKDNFLVYFITASSTSELRRLEY